MVFHLRYVFWPKEELGKSHNLLWINAFKAQGGDSEFYRSLRLPDTDGGDHFCHPGFVFSGLGALRGTVVAKRL